MIIKLIIFLIFGFTINKKDVNANGFARDVPFMVDDIMQFVPLIYAAGLISYFELSEYDSEKSNLENFRGVLELGAGVGLTTGLTYALKYTVRAERPNGSIGSFPSAHTSVAFGPSVFIHKRYGFLYSLPAYLVATTVAVLRVGHEAHYWQDVVAGAALAGLVGYFVTSEYKFKDGVISTSVMPRIGGGMLSVNFRWK